MNDDDAEEEQMGVRGILYSDRPPLAQSQTSPPCMPEAIEFTSQQRDALRDALLEAHLAVLKAIAREAARPDSYDGPRNVNRLTAALQGLRSFAVGLPSRGEWFGYAPGTGAAFTPGDDEDDEEDT